MHSKSLTNKKGGVAVTQMFLLFYSQHVSVQIHIPYHLNPQEDFWYSFLLEAELTPGP
jgi:hypothetical protein